MKKIHGAMILSDLSWSIRGTLGRKLLAMAQQYEDVVDFTLGDPDIPTPEGICDAAERCIREGAGRIRHFLGSHPSWQSRSIV